MSGQQKIIGKTYSLYGSHESTEPYYLTINSILDELSGKYSEGSILLEKLRKAGRSSSRAKPFITVAEERLSGFMTSIDDHLKDISFFKRLSSSVLSQRKYQYLLNMIEAELTNRLNKEEFLNSEKKIALLPHCLRDLSRNCRARKDDIDYLCQRCSPGCFINKATKLLNEHGIKAYIWKEAGRGIIFSKRSFDAESLGVLGIACIPELVNGMRYCSKKNIPVVGIPLDANRCVRWMGDFYDNSVNLSQLKKLLS